MSDETTGEDVLSRFAAIVQEVGDLPVEQVLPEMALRADLGLDSLAMVEVVVATEETFGVRIPDEEAQQLRTVADYLSYLEHRAE